MHRPSRGAQNGDNMLWRLCVFSYGVLYNGCSNLELQYMRHTFDRLEGKEVMNSQLNALLGFFCLLYDISLILKNHAAGELWMFSPKLFEVLTKTTAHVDKKRCFGIQPLTDSLLYGVEAFVTPAGLSLTISAHIVVELHRIFWIFGEPQEKGFLRLVCKLKGTVRNVPWVFIARLLEVSRNGME